MTDSERVHPDEAPAAPPEDEREDLPADAPDPAGPTEFGDAVDG